MVFVDRVNEGRRGVAPNDASLLEIEGAEERGGPAEGMNRGADIVHEAWHREFGRPDASAQTFPRLEDENRESVLRKGDGSGEPIRSAPDDDGVMRHSLILGCSIGATHRQPRAERVRLRPGPPGCLRAIITMKLALRIFESSSAS